jgi:hypothetical protein
VALTTGTGREADAEEIVDQIASGKQVLASNASALIRRARARRYQACHRLGPGGAQCLAKNPLQTRRLYLNGVDQVFARISSSGTVSGASG